MNHENVDWSQAACLGTYTESWYVEGHAAHAEYMVLRRVCKDCPIRNECAEYAISNEVYGFWGGLAPKERERLRSRRGIRLRTWSNAA
jgi:WhiB family redox-sensing transcriptional regulator